MSKATQIGEFSLGCREIFPVRVESAGRADGGWDGGFAVRPDPPRLAASAADTPLLCIFVSFDTLFLDPPIALLVF